jgi:hypothetical protein
VPDGLSNTFLVGEAVGGNEKYPIRDPARPGQLASNPIVTKTLLEQSWGATGISPPSQPWYAGVLAVTAQYGLAPDYDDEPMNRTPGTPTVYGGDSSGMNSQRRDFVSGFRGVHPGGVLFAMGDGSVRWLREGIDPAAYRGLSTAAGGEPPFAE